MFMWKNVRFLIKYESVRTGWGWLWTTIFYFFFSLTTVSLLYSQSYTLFTRFAADIFFLAVTGTIGFTFMSRDYGSNWWKSHALSKKLTLLKSLPVTTFEIVFSRYIAYLLVFVIMSLVYFVPLYFISQWELLPLTREQYISFVFIWLGYSLACGGLYLLMELSLKERTYFICCVLHMFLLIFVVAGLQLAGIHLVEESMELAGKSSILAPLISIAVGGVIQAVCLRISVRRLDWRDAS